MIRTLLLVALGLPACGGGWADVAGTIGAEPFDDVPTVYHGGPFIVLADRKMDCIDVAWAEKHYNPDGFAEDSPAAELDFVVLQFAFGDGAAQVGTFSLLDGDVVDSVGLVNLEGNFERHTGREGSLSISYVDGATVVGSYEVAFLDSSSSGEFETEYCRNLTP
jgi:hypothetical protein